MDNEEPSQRRVVQTSTPNTSTSMSTKSFLISPPPSTHQHKTRAPISSTAATTNNTSSSTLNPHFPAMIPNSNNTFAPRISSTVSQKNPWPTPPLHMTSSTTRQPLNTAHKRPGPPIVYPQPSTTAQRNSNNNNNPSTMRMTPSTSLQPQSFDAFSINPPTQRRPNGITHSTIPSNIPPRNPIRVSEF